MEHLASHIPFPQAGDSPLLGTLGGKRLADPGYHLNHRRLASSHSQPSSETKARLSFPSEASSASSSSIQGESLPSIRNLLHSIGHEADQSANLMRRSPSAPNLPSTHYASPPDSLPVLVHNGGSLSKANTNGNANAWMGPPYNERQKTSSWESSAVPLRSMSPQRRPPLAPSAFAHSQYSHHANSRSDGALIQPYRPASATGGRTQRGLYAPASQGDSYKKRKSLHSPSSSIPSITSEELNEMPLPSLGAWNKGEEENGSSAKNLMKRNLQSQQELDDTSASPSGTRRRHTVGALEEPHGLHTAIDQSQELTRRSRKITADSTPRVASQQHLRAYVPRPDSPTTPTAGNMASRFQSGIRRDSGNGIGGMMASHAPQHRIYLQQADHATGSLPSLSSSTSNTSGFSDRVRVHSLEELRERRVLPSGWASAAEAIYMDKIAAEQPLPNVRAPNWHSRSSTLDSMDSTSSFASNQSPYNRPLLPPRSSSLYVEENGDTGVWTATPTRRARDMATPYAFARERTRRDSIRGADIHRSNSMRTEPVSIYNRASLESPMEASLRPRAQTMAYTDRGAVQQPPPFQGQGLYLQNASSTSSVMTSMSSRPLSSHSISSVASLPQRVSSMEINQDGSRVRHYAHSPSSSIGSSTLQGSSVHTITPTNAASYVAVSGTGHAGGPKYECGWCGKRFSRPSSLKIHHHSHTGEKPFACSAPNCGRTFSVQSNLRRHQKCHSSQESAKVVANEDGPLVGYTIQQRTSVRESPDLSFSRGATAPSSHFNNQLYPFQQVAMPPGYSSSELGVNHSRQDLPSNGLGNRNHTAPPTNSFMQSREQVTSSTSSNAEEEEDEIADEDDDDSMQDIQQGEITGSPRHRSALQGLLNP